MYKFLIENTNADRHGINFLVYSAIHESIFKYFTGHTNCHPILKSVIYLDN